MKKVSTFLLMLVALCTAFQVLASEPRNYYNNALGKNDEALMNALNSIIHNHDQVSYSSGLLQAFAIADVDSDGYIIDIYSNCRYKTSDNGSSASHVGEGYNREHSFPRSWFGGEVAPMNTDVFHIYPTDIRVNSQRGNNPYGVCANGTRLSYGSYVAKGKLGQSTYPGYNGTVFEPDDEYKGDLARTFFYMATCYKYELQSWPGSPQLDYATNKYKAFSTWTINMLMEWTRLDPVSEKEIKRNEAVYGIQGNRNPFIDHPELAEYIWGNMQGQKWNDTGQEVQPVITSPVDGEIIDMGSTTVGTELTYQVLIKGEGLTERLTTSMSDNEYFYVNASSFSASEANSGAMLTVTFTADDLGTFNDTISISSSEVSTTVVLIATATDPGIVPPPVVLGDSIMEDWEGCTTGGYWNDVVEGNAWTWDFVDAGIWSDSEYLRHGELSCRMGKSSSSSITMAEDVEGGTSAISFWAASFNNDKDANLRVDYSTDHGTTWSELGDFTVTRGALQQIILDIPTTGSARFRIVQTSGMRVNIDDITIFGRPQHLLGDVNNDGEVNISDINVIVDIILGGTVDDETMNYADIASDNEINIADINALLDLILAD